MEKAAREKARKVHQILLAWAESPAAADMDVMIGLGIGILGKTLDDLDAADSDNARLRARVAELEVALGTAIKVADEARREWDAAPNGMKAGKLLIAMSDASLKYRADITAMHKALPAPPVGDR